MQKHRICLKWPDTGKELLTQAKDIIVEIINVCEMGPYVLAHSNLSLPLRTLPIHNAHVEIAEDPQEQIYKVKPDSLLSVQYPNLIVIPAIYITPKQADTTVLFVLVTH